MFVIKNQGNICTTLNDKLMVSLQNTNLIQNKLDYTYKIYMYIYVRFKENRKGRPI